MKIILLLAVACFSFLFYFAQTSTYTVTGNEDINKTLLPAQRFQYTSFVKGHVVFKDGKEAFVPLNYNWVLGDVQFINPKSDTLSLKNEINLSYITIGEDSFFYQNTYLQEIDGSATVKLAKHVKLRLSDIKKTGAFDTRTSGVQVITYSSVNVNSGSKDLAARQELIIKTTTDYYIGDTYHHFLPANKKNLLKIAGKEQKAVEAFLQDNQINFNKEEDLRKVVAFLTEQG